MQLRHLVSKNNPYCEALFYPAMIEQVAAAFDRKDYQTAARLLKQLVKQESPDPWVQLYVARLHEVTGKLESAENVYRQLLRDTTNAKLLAQARQGLGRVEAIEKERKRQAIAQATADPKNTEPGVLVLEPISSDLKLVASQKFARIMQLDPYIARLHLPSRGWRLYRTGAVGEMRYYSQQLAKAGIPSTWASLTDIEKINIFHVNYFKIAAPQPTIICENESGQLGSLTFDWSEVKARVEGLLPVFEEVVDMDARRKLQRKTKTLDYVQFCDLHLPDRRSILRLGDRSYQFQYGVSLSQKQEEPLVLSQTTTRSNWNHLISFLAQNLPQTPVWSDFTTFGETALESIKMLGRFNSHINLVRREETPWDAAFQLYSGLVFLRKVST